MAEPWPSSNTQLKLVDLQEKADSRNPLLNTRGGSQTNVVPQDPQLNQVQKVNGNACGTVFRIVASHVRALVRHDNFTEQSIMLCGTSAFVEVSINTINADACC